MSQKLRAMLDARTDPNFFVVARTDAIAVTGLSDALDRLEAYSGNRRRWLVCDAARERRSDARDRAPAQALGKPILFNMVRSGKSPFICR